MFDALGESAEENELEVLHEYLDEKEPETWARGAIRSRTYNQSTNNLAEGFNNVISSARDKNVLGMLNSIVQKWHYERRRSAHDAEGDDEMVLGWVRDRGEKKRSMAGTSITGGCVKVLAGMLCSGTGSGGGGGG